jgi:hypothetical protein
MNIRNCQMLFLHRSTTAAVVSLSGAVIVTCNGTTDQRNKPGAQHFQRDRTAQTRVLLEILAVGWPATCIMPLAYCCLLHGPSRKFITLQRTAAGHANAGALALAMIQNYERLIHGQSLPFDKTCATGSSATQCGSAAPNIMIQDDC